jgi:hypothetical protein
MLFCHLATLCLEHGGRGDTPFGRVYALLQVGGLGFGVLKSGVKGLGFAGFEVYV